jgi:flagellar biosynthesis anti-sigma factor FlgM
MKIEGGINPLTGTARKETAERTAGKKSGTASSQEEGGAFNVTFTSTTEKLLASAPTEETIRWEKVLAVRDQLAAGTYTISGRDVAAKLLNALKD